MEAEAWLEQAGPYVDERCNRRFLSTFAIYLVKQFRSEEERLRLARHQDLKCRINDNHRLAQHLRELMLDLDLGIDVTRGIRTFLGAWMRHRQYSPPSLRAHRMTGN